MKRDTFTKVTTSVLPIFLSFLFMPLSVTAQNLPPGDQPGAQVSRFQAGAEDERKALEKKKFKLPEIEMAEEKEKEPVEAGEAFILNDVRITGVTIFEYSDFASCYETYLFKEVTLKDLETIAEKIKAKYKAKGNLTAIVYVPEQDIKDGKVEIRVIEGRVGEIKVEGNKWARTQNIEKYIHIKKNDVLNLFTLQKDLIRLNQNSDLEVKTVIAAGLEPGTSDIILQVKDKFPYHAGTSVDNQGTRLVGKYRNSLSFRSSNLTSYFCDSLFVTTIMSALSSGNFVSYVIPIDTYGTKFGLDFTSMATKLGKEYKALAITGDTRMWTPHISGEIYLSDDFQANIDTGLEIKSIRKYILGEISTNDQLRIPYVSFDLTKMDSLFGGGQTSFSPRVSFGTAHFLGASARGHPDASRSGTGGFYAKYEQTLKRTQRMPFESYISVRSRFQMTSNTLPSSEQIQFGGANTIRGYPEGEYTADFGADLSADWVFPMYLIPKGWKLPYAEAPLRQQIQPVVFMDLGAGKIMKPGPGEKKLRLLMGLGGGVKFQFNRNLFLRLEWAERVGDRPTQNQGPSNFHMAIQCEI